MNQDHPSMHETGKELKHQGWKDEAAGTIKEAAGQLTGNEDKEDEGAAQKAVGDMERKTGKFVENVTK